MISMNFFRRGLTVLAATAAGATAMGVLASTSVDAREMFEGKTIRVIIGYGAGGGYDRYGRQVAKHIGKHLPGKPNVVAQNMPGAGSYKAVNFIYNQAPKDGTHFATFARSVPILAFSGKFKRTRFDPLKLTWIGTSSSYKGEAYVMVVRKDTGIKNIADMRQSKKTLNFASTSFGSDGTDVPIVLRSILGINVQPLRGYPGGNTLYLAVDRSEAQARMVGFASMKTARPGWLKKDSPIRVVLQFATETRLPEFPDAPTAREVVHKKADLDLIKLLETPFFMARPFAGPPDLPADRVKALRTAFMAAHADPAYKADAKKLRLITSPLDGAAVHKLVERLSNMPPALYARYTKMLKNPKSAVRKVNWIKVSGVVTSVGKRGRFKFMIGGKGKAQKARMRGSYTKVKVNGKKAKSKAVKEGMTCNIWWEGPKSTPGRVECMK
ncbi:MAG: tripartite-type tricarboxylate transporter receptor subunit TctC [Alphaproteobacteria bacterium]|jgi:tripartite-type tricarboxylate transporter receptor subunit TctC